MFKIGVTALLVAIVNFGLNGEAKGQSVCDRLVDRLQPDRLFQASTEARFELFQSIVRDDRYAAWSSASESRLDSNLSVPGYVDWVLGTESRQNNWSQNRQQFLDARWSQFSANRGATLAVEQVSLGAARAVVDCARVFADRDRQGFFGVLASVSERRNQFTIRLERVQRQGIPARWEIRSIGPQQAGLRCDDDWHRATPTAGMPYDGLTLMLNCSKDENRALDVTVVTSVGDAGPFRLASLADELAEMRRLVARAEAAAGDAVPRGAVGFFNLASCPPGWMPMREANGRYLVGISESGTLGAAVGEALTDQENRATGSHTHTLRPDIRNVPIFDARGQGDGFANGRGSAYITDPFPTAGPIPFPSQGLTAGRPGRDVAGTNAPYLQLQVCRRG